MVKFLHLCLLFSENLIEIQQFSYDKWVCMEYTISNIQGIWSLWFYLLKCSKDAMNVEYTNQKTLFKRKIKPSPLLGLIYQHEMA